MVAKLAKFTLEDLTATQKGVNTSHIYVSGSSNCDVACHQNFFEK